MAFPLLPLAGLAISGLGLWSGGRQNKRNIKFQKEQNLEDRRWERYMYDVKRKDALSDFDLQNAYNSPEQQMQRLKEAGLNPHLVYGSGATTEGATVRSSTGAGGNQAAPKVDNSYVSKSLSIIPQTMLMQGQLENMAAQRENIQSQTALNIKEQLVKDMQIANMGLQNEKGTFELTLARELKDTTIAKALADLAQTGATTGLISAQTDKTETETQYLLDKNDRDELANSANVALTLERILSEKIKQSKDQAEIDRLKQVLLNLETTNDLQNLLLQMKLKGIEPTDALWLRMLNQWINKGNTVNDLVKP